MPDSSVDQVEATLMSKIKVVHYLNQFFAGIGGEEKADYKPEVRTGVVGPGMALNKEFGDEAEIVATVICGDSYFNENLKEAQEVILKMVKEHQPDLFIAGPAFNAGRYGTACGTICRTIREELKIPVISAMYEENPGVDMYRKELLIIKTTDSAAGMRTAAPALAKLALKLAKGEEIGSPEAEGYHVRGVRKNVFLDKTGGERAVEMMIKKLKGEAFVTEYPMPVFDHVAPNPAVKSMKTAKIALVTSGGTVPKGNPDRIESSSASKYGKYDISGLQELAAGAYETAHGGYDPVYANNVPDRVLPVDVLRDMEKEGRIGSLHQYFYTTVGNGTSVANSKQFASTFAKELIADGVTAVILTSTWGTCTRCGATMVKEIERAGLPVVHICTVVPISLTVGANRIVPAIAIPHPLGDPNMDAAEEKRLRRKLVEKCLVALETEVDGQTVFDK